MITDDICAYANNANARSKPSLSLDKLSLNPEDNQEQPTKAKTCSQPCLRSCDPY